MRRIAARPRSRFNRVSTARETLTRTLFASAKPLDAPRRISGGEFAESTSERTVVRRPCVVRPIVLVVDGHWHGRLWIPGMAGHYCDTAGKGRERVGLPLQGEVARRPEVQVVEPAGDPVLEDLRIQVAFRIAYTVA